MTTFIVLIPLEENRDARKQCETIENFKFNMAEFNCETAKALQVKEKVIELIDDNTYDLSTIEVEPITDFMDRVNDEQFNDNAYFISYVNA